MVCEAPIVETVNTEMQDFSFSKLIMSWITLNNNLNQKPVEIMSTFPIDIGQCESTNLIPQESIPSSRLCLLRSLSETFNFTTFDPHQIHIQSIYWFGYDYSINSDIVNMYSRDPPLNARPVLLYYGTHKIVKFLYVAQIPTAFEGLISFLSPFNYIVWLSLFSACLAITLVIRYATHPDARNLTEHNTIHNRGFSKC